MNMPKRTMHLLTRNEWSWRDEAGFSGVMAQEEMKQQLFKLSLPFHQTHIHHFYHQTYQHIKSIFHQYPA